jgi:hypothetical protein
MSRHAWMVVVAIAVLAAAFTTCFHSATAQPTTPHQKWQYARLSWEQIEDRGYTNSWYSHTPGQPRHDEGKEVLDGLNRLGTEGWQVVAFGSQYPWTKTQDSYLLMRPAP